MFAKHMRRIQLTVTALATVAMTVGSFAAPSVQAQSKKVLNYVFDEPGTLDPQVGSFVDGVIVDNALFRGLLKYDHNNQPAPSIAKDVPTLANGGISADGKTYTYHLRQDWKWSDGNGVVKAGDFVYAFQRLVDPKMAAGYGSFLDGLLLNADHINNGDAGFKLSDLGVKAVDDYTVQFTLVHAASYWNLIACLWFGYAVRKDNVERAGDPSTGAWVDPANGPVVGSGPFTISAWDHNKEIDLVKNANFAGDQAKLDQISFPIITDASIALTGFKSGKLDIGGYPAAQFRSLKADPVLGKDWKGGANQGFLSDPSTCQFYMGMDNTKPPFNNIDVRKAFSYAINRDDWVHTIRNDQAQKLLSFLPPSIQDSDPKLGSDYDFSPDKAKAALAKAGFPNGAGFPAVSYHYSAGTNNQRIADWYQAQFQKYLNVTITEDPMDSAVYSNALSDAKNKLDGTYTLGWCADYLHPSDWLIPVFGSNYPNGNATNAPGYRDPQFDKIANQADNTADPAAADKLYQQAQGILINDVPVAFLAINTYNLLVSARVTNLPETALDSGYPGGYYWEEVDVKS